MMNQRERDDLDNYITGHYGEDQFRGMAEPNDDLARELKDAWQEVVDTHGPIWYEAEARMEAAMDAIIAALNGPECGCGHPAHPDGPVGVCTGTLSTMSDGDTVAFMVRDGADPNEPCVCTAYVPMRD